MSVTITPVPPKPTEYEYMVDVGGSSILLTETELRELAKELAPFSPGPFDGLHIAVTPTMFTYERIAREGFVIGLQESKAGVFNVEVLEVWNSRDGTHDEPKYKLFTDYKIAACSREIIGDYAVKGL